MSFFPNPQLPDEPRDVFLAASSTARFLNDLVDALTYWTRDGEQSPVRVEMSAEQARWLLQRLLPSPSDPGTLAAYNRQIDPDAP